MSKSQGHTHRKDLARKLMKETGWGYQKSLNFVTDMAERGFLPSNLDEVGSTRALSKLVKLTGGLEVPSLVLPKGLTQQSYNCWILMENEGYMWEEGDGVPHFRNEAKAQERIEDHRSKRWLDEEGKMRLEALKPLELAFKCVFIRCSKCDYLLDEEECGYHFDPNEFPDTLSVWGVVKDYEWEILDGELLCPECVCEAKGHVFTERFSTCARCSASNPNFKRQ